MSKGKSRKEFDVEAAVRRLEEIVAALEAGGLALRDSIKLFEEGQELSRRCEEELDAAEERITLLIDRGRDKPAGALDLAAGDDVSVALDGTLSDDERAGGGREGGG